MRMKKDKVGITETWDSNVDLRKFKNKWKNKKEYQTVKVVIDRHREMQDGRRTSCPWSTTVSDAKTSADSTTEETVSGTGSNWKYRWDMDYKLWSMWFEYISGRSNLKSPISFAPIEALMAEFQENDLGVTMTATQQADESKVLAYKYINEFWKYKANLSKANVDTMKESAITGTAIRNICWHKVEREVEIIQDSQKVTEEVHKIMREGSKEEKEKVKKLVDNDKKPLTKKTTIIEYDDVAHIPVSIYEFYVDPSAREMRAPAYEATDCEWRQTPTLEQFRAHFKGSKDPFVISDNIDRVKEAGEAEQDYGDTAPFFKVPEDFADESQIELIHYYNKQTDKYIIVANDILIRDGPLPYNHKELPFSIHKFIKWPHQFYGVGIATVLESLQAEDETLRNMMLEQLKLEINRPMFIPTDIFEDVDSGWERVEPGLKVPVSGDPSRITWAPSSGFNPNYGQMRSSIDTDSVKVSGINPMSYAMPKADEPVRNNMMAIESSLKMIKKGVKNYSEGFLDAMKQTIKLWEQYYPGSYVEKLSPEGKIEEKPRMIRTRGVQLQEMPMIDEMGMPLISEKNEIEIELVESRLEENESGYFEIKDEYLNLDGDIDIKIDVDTLVPISQGLKMQNADRFMQTLLPIVSNPELMQRSEIAELLRYYYEVNGVPQKVQDLLIDKDSDEEVERANEQHEVLVKGESLPGIPGESKSHMDMHRKLISELIAEKEKLSSDPTALLQSAQELDNIIKVVSDHLQEDAVPKGDATQYTLQKAQDSIMPPQPTMMPPEQDMTGQPMNSDMAAGGEMLPPEMTMGPGAGQPMMPPQGPGY